MRGTLTACVRPAVIDLSMDFGFECSRVNLAPARATIQRVVETDPEKHVTALAALSGVVQALSNAINRNLGDWLSLPMIILLVMLVGGAEIFAEQAPRLEQPSGSRSETSRWLRWRSPCPSS
jgi:hypothetical protein